MAHMLAKWNREFAKEGLNENTYFGRMSQNIAEGEQGKISENEAISDATSMIAAGLHLTMHAIEAALWLAAKHPGVQERVFADLAAHYDKHGAFEVNKMRQMHVFRAFVWETLRVAHPINGTLHRTGVDGNEIKQMSGYNVPPGARIAGLTLLFHVSKKHWERPNELSVEHFLDEKGEFKMNPAFTLFGFGKRNCIGKNLAINELLCILAQLLYRYKFRLPADLADDFTLPMDWIRNVKQLPLVVLRRG